jgi:hypothetical protein
MPNPVVVEYDADLPRAIKAVVAIVARLGYTLSQVDKENGLVTFETGASMDSWAGQNMSVHISDFEESKVQIIIGGTRKNYGKQIYDWGESKKIALKIIEELNTLLGSGKVIESNNNSKGSSNTTTVSTKQKGNNPPVEGSKSLPVTRILNIFGIVGSFIVVGLLLFSKYTDHQRTEQTEIAAIEQAERAKIEALERQQKLEDYADQLIFNPRMIISLVDTIAPTELEKQVKNEKYDIVNKFSSLSPDKVKDIKAVVVAAGKARWALLEPKILADRKMKALEEAKRLAKEAEEKIRAQTTPIDFVTKSKAMCQKYNEAKNDIQRSNIFNNHQSMLSSSTVQNKRGTIKQISTDRGGNKADIFITFGANVEFENWDVQKGTKAYNQAANFGLGECVVFSGNNIRSSSRFERSHVCDSDYYITLTALLPCPK